MNFGEACRVLGVRPEAGPEEIKKQYRQLMLRVHPDARGPMSRKATEHAQKINQAYGMLKREWSRRQAGCLREESARDLRTPFWDGPVNPGAYCEREILHYAEDSQGEVLGSFAVAKGRFLWTPAEDFSLFLRSVYRCSVQLIRERIRARQETSQKDLVQIQGELFYLLAQQFIDVTGLLKLLGRREPDCSEKEPVFLLSAVLEYTCQEPPVSAGELLCPSGLRRHRLFVKSARGIELGYLSFPDDRLYYAAIPLFEQKKAQVKIQTSSQASRHRQKGTRYQQLDLWIRLAEQPEKPLPENLNHQIRSLLERIG